MSNDDDKPDHVVDGEAKDQETILRQRKHIEDFVSSNFGDIKETKLYWNMTEKGTFHFELHFWFKQQSVD